MTKFIVVDAFGDQLSTDGQPYSGPVDGLTSEYIWAGTGTISASSVFSGTEDVSITANTSNVFIEGGPGMDFLDASQCGGVNVIDGGSGSDFMIGGPGMNQFYIDIRNPQLEVNPPWSTVAGLHSGDNVTIWGLTAADFSTLWNNNRGAPGFTGLTGTFITSTQTGTSILSSVTLAGFSSADLSNGRLSLSYGTTSNLPNLPGSPYLTIHVK